MINHTEADIQVYEACIITATMASIRKVKAGLEYAASGEHQDYPPGTLELGVALDAVDMVLIDVLHCIELNSPTSCQSCNQTDQGQTGEHPCPECGLPRLWDDQEG